MENKTLSFITKEDLLNTESSLKHNLSEMKIDLIKWMFGFWISTMLMIAGLYLKR